MVFPNPASTLFLALGALYHLKYLLTNASPSLKGLGLGVLCRPHPPSTESAYNFGKAFYGPLVPHLVPDI